MSASDDVMKVARTCAHQVVSAYHNGAWPDDGADIIAAAILADRASQEAKAQEAVEQLYDIAIQPLADELCDLDGLELAEHWMKRAEAAEAEVSRLTKRVEEAAEVIEPFARVAEHDIGESEDWGDQFRPMGGGHNTVPLITVGDMRAARDFLQKNGGGNG